MNKKEIAIKNSLVIFTTTSWLMDVSNWFSSAKVEPLIGNWTTILFIGFLLLSGVVWIYFAVKEQGTPNEKIVNADKSPKKGFVKYHPYIYVFLILVILFQWLDYNYFSSGTNKNLAIHKNDVKSKTEILQDYNDDKIFDIPTDVESIWVFLQNEDFENPICERLDDAISPNEFKNNFNDYIIKAKEEQMTLIVTALKPPKSWVQDDIKINGYITKPMAKYTCNGVDQIDYGAAIIPK